MSATVDRFIDRAAAGERLARALRRLSLSPPLIVLALPRGGVPVAFEIARALAAPLDVLVVRKIGMPGQPELAIGAIATGDVIVHEPAAALGGPDAATFAKLVMHERAELNQRESAYRSGLAPLDLRGKTVILVDDGLATGATMLAALRAARRAGAVSVIVAAPVASDEGAALVGREADRLVILKIPRLMHSVGEWYLDFRQVEDEEVRELLQRASDTASPATD